MLRQSAIVGLDTSQMPDVLWLLSLPYHLFISAHHARLPSHTSLVISGWLMLPGMVSVFPAKPVHRYRRELYLELFCPFANACLASLTDACLLCLPQCMETLGFPRWSCFCAFGGITTWCHLWCKRPTFGCLSRTLARWAQSWLSSSSTGRRTGLLGHTVGPALTAELTETIILPPPFRCMNEQAKRKSTKTRKICPCCQVRRGRPLRAMYLPWHRCWGRPAKPCRRVCTAAFSGLQAPTTAGFLQTTNHNLCHCQCQCQCF